MSETKTLDTYNKIVSSRPNSKNCGTLELTVAAILTLSEMVERLGDILIKTKAQGE